jgi:hypothetical protein
MDLEVVIEGVSDVRLAKAIRRALRRVCKDAGRPGEWSAFLSPSETRGQWDLGVRGPSCRHFASFTADADRLPVLVAEHMRACL